MQFEPKIRDFLKSYYTIPEIILMTPLIAFF